MLDDKQHLDGGECLTVHLLTLEEIKQLLAHNEIIQSKFYFDFAVVKPGQITEHTPSEHRPCRFPLGQSNAAKH